MGDDHRAALFHALGHIRAALTAHRQGAPVAPPLLAAEETVLRILFTDDEVDAYLASPGAKVFGREP